MTTVNQSAYFSSNVYDNSGTPFGWTQLNITGYPNSNLSTGFYAAAYQNEATGEIIIAYSGTQPTDTGDLAALAQIAAGQVPDQYNDAASFYNAVRAQYGADANITLTGHSLGGSLASLVAASFTTPDSVLQANVFNAVGAKGVLTNLGLDSNATYANIHNYNAVFDPASNLPLNQIGSIQTAYVSSFALVPDWMEQLVVQVAPNALLRTALQLYFYIDQHDIDNLVSIDWTNAQLWTPPRRDPLVLDLDADGLETTALNTTNPIYFDHDGDGVKTATGWIKPDDGFLVLDRNANGIIDNGRELFGDATLIPNGTGGTRNAVDGFEALSAQDTNVDGKVDNTDTNFTNLRIWQDLNQDGTSQSNELFTLTSLNIASINVAKTENNTLLPNGNVIADLGTYTKTDGTTATLGDTAQLGDVDLRENTFYSAFANPITLTPEAQALPNMRGSGQVRDLREAVSLSPSLTTTLTSFTQATTRTGQRNLLDPILQAWSNTSTLLTTATGAYAGHPLTITFEGVTAGSAAYNAWLDQLSILERFNGRTFRVVPTGTDPVTVSFSSGQMTLLDQSYSALKESAYSALFLQTRGKPYLDAIGLNTDTAGNVTLDFFAMETLLNTRVSTDTASGLTDIADLARAANADLKASGWDSYLFLGNTLNGIALTSHTQPLALKFEREIEPAYRWAA